MSHHQKNTSIIKFLNFFMKIIYKNLITFFIFIHNFILFNSLLILKRQLIPNIIFEGYISIISSTLVFLLFFILSKKNQ